MEQAKSNLSRQIVIALFLGAIVGILLRHLPSQATKTWLEINIFTTIGTLFINALKMLVVPLVFISLTLLTIK